jgi:hypothetical protein
VPELITGDQDLVALGGELPILTPARFAAKPRKDPVNDNCRDH